MTGFCPHIWSLRETVFGLISTSTPIIAPDIGMTRVAQKKMSASHRMSWTNVTLLSGHDGRTRLTRAGQIVCLGHLHTKKIELALP